MELILPSNCNEPDLWSLNLTLTCENVDLNVSNVNVDGEITIKLQNGLLGMKILESYRDELLTRFQWTSTTLVMSSRATFSPFF